MLSYFKNTYSSVAAPPDPSLHATGQVHTSLTLSMDFFSILNLNDFCGWCFPELKAGLGRYYIPKFGLHIVELRGQATRHRDSPPSQGQAKTAETPYEFRMEGRTYFMPTTHTRCSKEHLHNHDIVSRDTLGDCEAR